MHSHKKKLHMPHNYHFLRHFFVLQRYSLQRSSDLTPKNDVTKPQMQSNRLEAGAVQGCQLSAKGSSTVQESIRLATRIAACFLYK